MKREDSLGRNSSFSLGVGGVGLLIPVASLGGCGMGVVGEGGVCFCDLPMSSEPG